METKRLNLYDFVVMFYVISIFAFENKTFSLMFRVIQLIYIAFTLIFIIMRGKVTFNIYIFSQIAALIIALLIELFGPYSLGKPGNEISIFYGNIIKIFFLIQYFISKEEIDKTILFIVIGGIVASAFVFLDYYSMEKIDYDLKYVNNYRIGADISGGNVNITSMNLCFSFSSGLYYFYSEKKNLKKKIIYILCICLIFSAIIFTGSRKSILFLLIVYLLQTYSNSKKKTALSVILIVFVYICLMKIDLFYFYMGHKFDIFGSKDTVSIYNYSDMIRKNFISDGLKLFIDNLFGVGFGGVAKNLGDYAHNNFVEILTSLGIIGLIAYYLPYIYALIKLIKIKIPKELFVYFVSSIIGLMVIEWFQVTYLYKIPMIFIALATSCASLKEKAGIEYCDEPYIE